MVEIKKFFLSVTVLVLSFCLLVTSCSDIHRNNSHPEISNNSIRKGKSLASDYCQRCHALPDPNLLDSKTWEQGVLPAMGPRLGIFSWNYMKYPSSRNDINLEKGFYPQEPLLKPQEWKSIIDYYVATSPENLVPNDSAQKTIKNDLVNFAIKTSSINYPEPASCLLKFFETSFKSSFLVEDAVKQMLYRIDGNLTVIDSVNSKGPLLDVEAKGKNWLICDVGVMNPNNGKYGSVANITLNSSDKFIQVESALFQGLARPVQTTSADFNNDGKKDYLVCEFGFQTGALSWMENKGNGKFDKHILRALPGAIKAYVEDYNHDGLQDIWALFAQGDEGPFLFINNGNGTFSQKQVLRFPPVYGSSYFEFADINKDGFADIVYTCGDNADYSTVLKPYHGVYIFINDGKNNFGQKYFFHINGCYKAIAKDYDNDGDVDIATISFFSDYKN
ncbi:MAG: FG-GAP repeat domain-containing protein, partial [Segetibacter sp.]